MVRIASFMQKNDWSSFMTSIVRLHHAQISKHSELTCTDLEAIIVRSSSRFMLRKHSQKKVIGSRKTVKVGPWGGHGGSPWDDGSYNGIREIALVYDRCIDSIRILYDKNGKPVLAEKHGGNGGNLTVQVKLRYPEEFLTSVSGHYSPVVHGGSPVIRSLTFKSNQRDFGPFGVEEGTPFTFPMDGGMIVGFSGRCGWYLDAIGLCLSPIRTVGLYDTVQQKLLKFGNLATKTLRNRNGEHGSQAKARTQNAHA